MVAGHHTMVMTTHRAPMAVAVAVLVVLACPALALAQVPSTGIYDDVLNRFAPHITQWETVVKRHATYLYWTLALISLTWTGVTLALKQADIQEFFGEFIKFTISTGFFWWLLDNGPALGKAVVDSMRLIGAEAAGVPGALNPSSLLNIGFDLLSKVNQNSSWWEPVDSAVMYTLAFIVLIVFALLGLEVIILILTGWILGYAGVIFLGFGGGRWTQEMAINYYKALLQLGTQMMAIILLMGIGKDVLTAMAATIGSNLTINGVAVLVVAVIVFYGLFTRIPYVLSGLAVGAGVQAPFTGAGGMGGGVMSMAGGAVGAAMGAAGLASGMIGTAFSGAKETASGMAGAASAVASAFGSAMQDRASGSGVFQGGEWGGGGGSVASGVGRAAQMATAVGGNLAAGVAGYAKEAAGEMVQSAKDGFKESVAGSLGAKIADQINGPDLGETTAADGAAMSNAINAFDPNGGGGDGDGWKGQFVSDEVANFVNNGSGGSGDRFGGAPDVGGGSGAGSGGGPGKAEPWMMASGGVGGLTPALRESAEKSFETWKERTGGSFGLGEYVNYVQDKWQSEGGKGRK